jgi:rare lipoprotein A
MTTLIKLAICACLGCGWMVCASADAAVRHATAAQKVIHTHAHEGRGGRRENRAVAVSRTGHVQIGRASVYGPKFTGKRMASGEKFDPASDSAASRSLPLGTVARVTNLENGRTATVRIRDRGPRRAGRILDVSPKTAERLGILENAVGNVSVARLTQEPARVARLH